jgi:hypothetical protein
MRTNLVAGPELATKACLASASLAALQPSLTGEAIVFFAAGLAIWAGLARRRNAAFVVTLAATLGGTAVAFGLSPVLAMVAVIVAITRWSDTVTRHRWLVAWIGALAVLHFPITVNSMLFMGSNAPLWSESAVAPVTFLALVALGGGVSGTVAIAAVFACLAGSILGYSSEAAPVLQTTLAALPAAIAILAPSPFSSIGARFAIGTVLVGAGGLSLVAIVPVVGLPGSIAVWIPPDKSPESRFYSNYESILSIGGFRSSRIVHAASDIRPHDWVVFPAAAHDDFNDQVQNLRALPQYPTLRVIVFGEHTDFNGVATALRNSGAPIGLNLDTTIPPGNRDLLGWSLGLGVIPSRSLALNRGASLKHLSWSVVPLVWIQGGHTELDRSDDGRLGDMRIRRGERVGLYSAIAAAREPRGPAWVVFGDSTPALNEFFAADAWDLVAALSIGSGVPALFGLVAWVCSWIALVWQGPTSICRWMIGLMLLPCFAALLSVQSVGRRIVDPELKRVHVTDRPLYGDQAVGRAIVALAPTLIEADVKLEIGTVSQSVSGGIVSIGHPLGWRNRTDCTRAGELVVKPLFFLDVVSCSLRDVDRVVGIGEDTIIYRLGKQLVVLDQHFLGNAASPENIEWLKTEMRRISR